MEKTTIWRMFFAVLFLHLSASDLGPDICKRSSRTVDCRNASLTKITLNLGEDTEVLDLSFNQIRILHNEFFPDVNVNLLMSIYLNDNVIIDLEPEVFKPLEALRHLHLQNNLIKSLHPSIFQTNTNLTTLDISGNQLMEINSNIFEKNYVLSWVDMTRNKLSVSYVHPAIFSSSLNTVDIDICKKPTYFINSFENVPYLKQLKLKESEVFTVKNLTSHQNIKHEELYSENNAISKLIKFGFAGHNMLRYDGIEKVVFLPENSSLVCFCPRLSAWFWCYEETFSCENRTADVYALLKCSGTSEIFFHTSSPLPRTQSTSTTPSSLPVNYTEAAAIYDDKTNVQDSENISGASSRPPNENSHDTHTVLYICIVVVSLIVAVVAVTVCYILKMRRERNMAEGHVQYSNIPMNTSTSNTCRSELQPVHYLSSDVTDLKKFPERIYGKIKK